MLSESCVGLPKFTHASPSGEISECKDTPFLGRQHNSLYTHSPQNSTAKQNGAAFGGNFEPHQAI